MEKKTIENLLDTYAQQGLDMWQLEQIRVGLEHGLTVEQVSIYAKPEIGWEEIGKNVKKCYQ